MTGLVAYSSGGNGSILFIEVADMPGSGSVQLTGKLGDVLKESVEVALSWVKAHAYELGLTHDPSENIMKNRSIHVHCPSGAIPKVHLSPFRIAGHFLTRSGWPFCRCCTYNCADLPLFWESSASNDCYDSKFQPGPCSWSLTDAVQGEMSLRGRVTAVGGIKEKLIGALRAGVKTVLLPAQNRKE